MNNKRREITEDVIGEFLSGRDPMERIVNLEYKYTDDKIKVIYRNANDERCEVMDYFHPFCWATRSACDKLCKGDRKELRSLMNKYGISVRKLDTRDTTGKERDEYENGYLFLFYTEKAMSYKKFLEFFQKADNPIYSKNEDNGRKRGKQYLIVTPQEQYMIASGKRFFKGYEDYDELLRLIFDLETEGLDPTRHRITDIGIRFNRSINTKTGFREYSQTFSLRGNTEEEKDAYELEMIKVMLMMINHYKPDIITAHNGENFDWWFIMERCKALGTTLEDLSQGYFNGESIRKNNRETILKLGGEVETFYQTIVPGTTITDSLHAVRRAQALDSNMERADLKYVTKYSKIVKINRVYVPGDMIAKVGKDLDVHYAFNDEDGDWYLYDPTHVSSQNVTFTKGMGPKGFTIYTRNYIAEGYTLVSGKYIIERYLQDDLWECDRVEHRYNGSNFLICKMLPVPFQKCCTMGTAGQWKSIMLAWSYENNLAVPMFGESKSFTGGLSRLLKVGFVDKVAKFDYNSLYPSITLTWDISDPEKDLMGAMLHFLEYVLLQREKYKGLMKKAGKLKDKLEGELANFNGSDAERKELEAQIRKAAEEKSSNDKKQLPMKILGNSFFGSYGAPNVFPFGSLVCAERITCTGRMSLRLMIYYFNNLGYEPIVGDSFTPDTPLFIKWKDSGMIDIRPVEQLITESEIKVDALGREYDYSEKEFEVLCRSGWMSPEYIYRHKTDKDIYEVSEGNMRVEITEDHSLFNFDKVKIKPSEITEDTKLEYYQGEIASDVLVTEEYDWENIARNVAYMPYGNIPCVVYNTTKENMEIFYNSFMENSLDDVTYSKTIMAGIQFIESKIKESN